MKLIAENISKTIRGKKILSEISLELEGGKIYGFTGPNGSGKTMLFRALSGLISVDSGIILWNSRVLRRDFSVLPSLGIILENVSLYSNLYSQVKDNEFFSADNEGLEVFNSLKQKMLAAYSR